VINKPTFFFHEKIFENSHFEDYYRLKRFIMLDPISLPEHRAVKHNIIENKSKFGLIADLIPNL
jgi:hypothetical protein